MSRDALEQLLRTADAAAPPAPLADDLAARVHNRLARRRQYRAVAAAAAVLMLIVGVAISIALHEPAAPAPPLAMHPATTSSAVTVAVGETDLLLTAELHELTAEKLLTARRTTAAEPPRRELTNAAVSDVRFQRDRAALILVYDADRLAQENRPAAAIAGYRRAVELFPTSHWARVARERLAQIAS
jgi:hypothetical protein